MTRLFVVAAAVGLMVGTAGVAGAAEGRPNIVMILGDDMGYSDLGCFGGEIHTPNLDALAKEGMRFTQFYNNARCCPSRASLMTGVYPHQAGIGAMCQDLGYPAYRGELNERRTIAERLRDAGYHTAMVGKWHLSHLALEGKKQLNFEMESNVSPEGAKSWPYGRGFEEHWGTIAGVGTYYDPWSFVHNDKVIKPESKDFYYTDFINDKAVELIGGFAKEKGKPFFLYVAEVAAHWPLHAHEEDVAHYKDTYGAGWDKIREGRWERQVEMGLLKKEWGLSARTEDVLKREPKESKVEAWEEAPEKEWQARRMAVYAAQVECMDRGVGKIVEALKANGLSENTLIVFMSDNGACAENVRQEWYDIPTKTRDGRKIQVGNDPKVMPGGDTTFQSYGPAWANASNTPFRRFKHWTQEGGIAAPCLVYWPGHTGEAGRLERHVGHVMDWAATFLDAAGVKLQGDDKLEGVSLVKTIAGTGEGHTGVLCWEHEGNRAVREGKWKLVAGHGEKWSLYDMEADRTERKDLSAENPGKVEELKEKYREWAERCGVRDWPVK